MKYFDRTRKLSNILIFISVLFLILTLVFLVLDGDQVLRFSNGNFVRAALYIGVCFTLFMTNLVTAIALKSIAKDAKEELDYLSKKG